MNTFTNSIVRSAATSAEKSALQILIAEDNDDLRQILTFLIPSLGIHGHFAANGKEALEIISTVGANNFDAILSDIEMPVMNGFEFLIKLREQKFNPPFIFMTAAPTRENLNRAAELGITDILEKPFDGDALLLRLNKALQI